MISPPVRGFRAPARGGDLGFGLVLIGSARKRAWNASIAPNDAGVWLVRPDGYVGAGEGRGVERHQRAPRKDREGVVVRVTAALD
jgi:hypothetical protein